MLEKGSWSHAAEGVFSSGNSDSYREAKRLASDDMGMSDHCFKSSKIDCGGSKLCTDDTILGDKCDVEDNSMCHYPTNQSSEADNELSFLDIDGWLDIGDFEDVDVDRLLSCDLTFGTESLNNEEEFSSWLASSQGAEGSDDALKSDFKFSYAEMSPLKSVSQYNTDSKESIGGLSMNDSSKKASPVAKKVSSQMDVDDDSVSAPLLMFGESGLKSGNIVDLVQKEKLQRKLQKPLSGRQKISYLENGDTIHPYTLGKYADIKQPYESSSSGVTSLDSIPKNKLNLSLGCTQTQTPIMHPNYSHAPNHPLLFSSISGPKNKPNGHLSASLKEPSYASSMESCHGHSLEGASLKTNMKRENLHHCHDGDGHMLSRSLKNEKISNQMPFHIPSSAQQIANQFENENEGHSEVCGVSQGFSPDIDSSTVQESSPMSTALDQNSVQATNFCHLQQIMGQLDIRTKLCIRDSLYRLAKSAEQRLDNSYTNGCLGDDVDACKAMMGRDASRCTGFMGIETDTNPIDRSVAHLLFHRPADSSMLLHNNNSIPFKTSGKIPESVIHPPVKTEKQVCQEDSSSGVEKVSRG